MRTFVVIEFLLLKMYEQDLRAINAIIFYFLYILLISPKAVHITE